MKKLSIEKKINASAFAFVAILSATAYSQVAQAAAGATASTSSTYIGADAVYGKMKFREYYGDNIFSKKWIPGVNLFVGHMFNENWGAEIGYEVDKKMKRTEETVAVGNTVAGTYLDPASLIRFASYNTSFKQHHAYLGATAKTNIFGDNNFVSLMLGISLSHIQAKYNYFRDGFGAADMTRTFSKTKPITIIRASVEHKLDNNFGLRLSTTWKNTSRFRVKSEEKPSSAAEIKLKDTINLGFGISYYI